MNWGFPGTSAPGRGGRWRSFPLVSEDEAGKAEREVTYSYFCKEFNNEWGSGHGSGSGAVALGPSSGVVSSVMRLLNSLHFFSQAQPKLLQGATGSIRPRLDRFNVYLMEADVADTPNPTSDQIRKRLIHKQSCPPPLKPSDEQSIRAPSDGKAEAEAEAETEAEA
eukprot:CAMPEP_0182553208 /NCGR_PEP_ID=MMETSP1323-20130603/49367_1 /TAXON_ID=236787 /ORGANISM="Florenciella parvula, Strain RCC1693" /LENGTH=165 /DNA_ID=CAMNT_0024764921 /DNA_START=1496 /DNA_END=1989 /DNA_ORIENTATION=-